MYVCMYVLTYTHTPLSLSLAFSRFFAQRGNVVISSAFEFKPHTASLPQAPFPPTFFQALVKIPHMLRILTLQPKPNRGRGPVAEGGAAVVEGGAALAEGGVAMERRAPSLVARNKQPSAQNPRA